MTDRLIPKGDAFSGFEPVSSKDFRFIEAFDDLATVLDECNNSEEVTLLLSSCRNPYFLVNSLFHDLRMILGWGNLGSLYYLAIYDISQNRLGSASNRLNRISRYMKAFTDKILVWEKREALFEEFNTNLANNEILKPVAQIRLKKILNNVRTISVNPHTTPWDPVLYAIDVSGKLNTDLATKKQTLERCNSALLAAKNLARALVSLLQAVGRNLSLIPNHVEQWNEFLARLIIFTQEACWLISTEETDDQILVTLWKDNNGNISKLYQLEKEFPNNFDVASFTAFFSDMLLSFGKRIYKDLFDEFTANPAVKKLPSPFIIDFGKIGYSASDKMFEYSVQIISPKDVPRPDTVKIALSNWGIPMNYYDFNHLDFKRFIADDLHALKESIIAAIVTAEENGANALIFPEFFIPRQFEDEIIKIAKDRGIVLVGGLEARTDHQGKIFNETIVCLPGFPQPFYQRKHHPSQEEPNTERFPKADTLYYFTNTTIGNFAVVVCSDYRELSYHKVITEQIYPEIIIVCTMNHAPELYQAMAVADADRYYSHVIVCNNYNDGEEFSTRGTLIASPKKMIDDYIRKPNSDELIKIEAPLVADQQPSLWIVNLDLNAIAHRDRGRPEKGFRNPPHCRR